MAGTVVRRLMRCGMSAHRDASHRWRSLLRLLLLLLLLRRRPALCWSSRCADWSRPDCGQDTRLLVCEWGSLV